MKRKKIPSNNLKAYQRGVTVGRKAGYRKAQEEMKQATSAAKAAKAVDKAFKAEYITQPIEVDQRAIKWQGFNEAMNLIIASKR